MKIQKVSQTAFGQKDGNCFPACLATLTGIPLSEFPFPPYVKGNWLRQVDKFLETKNLVYIEWAVTEAFPYFGRCLLIANGMILFLIQRMMG